MISRGTVIAALLVVELAIVGEAFVALRGDRPAPFHALRSDAADASALHLVEGGSHRVFGAGAHPTLSVDIGYADLTLVAHDARQIDVGASNSTDFGFLRSTAPISASQDGATIRISATAPHGWSMGDDRRVTVLVPPDTHVTVISAGDIKAQGLRAEAAFQSTGSGDVAIDDYDAPALRVRAPNGRVSLHQVVTPRLDVTGGDDVDGIALHVRDGTIETDGRVTLGFAAGTDTLVTAHTDDGQVRASGFAERGGLATARASGDDGDDAASQTVRVGAATGNLHVHSTDGDITLAPGR